MGGGPPCGAALTKPEQTHVCSVWVGIAGVFKVSAGPNYGFARRPYLSGTVPRGGEPRCSAPSPLRARVLLGDGEGACGRLWRACVWGGVAGAWWCGGVVWYSPGVCAHPPRLGVLPERCRGRVGLRARAVFRRGRLITLQVVRGWSLRGVLPGPGARRLLRTGAWHRAPLCRRVLSRGAAAAGWGAPEMWGGVASPGEFESAVPLALVCSRRPRCRSCCPGGLNLRGRPVGPACRALAAGG